MISIQYQPTSFSIQGDPGWPWWWHWHLMVIFQSISRRGGMVSVYSFIPDVIEAAVSLHSLVTKAAALLALFAANAV
jgi:hypothetical protein